MVNWTFENSFDEISSGKLAYLLMLFIVGASLVWLSINATTSIGRLADAYYPLMTLALLWFVIDAATEKAKGENIFSTSFWENDTFIGESSGTVKVLIVLLSVAVAISIFFLVITTQTSIIGTPQHLFQAAELGVTGDIWITIAASLAENALFFYAIMPSIFGVLFFALRGSLGDGPAGWISFVLAVLVLGPSIFTVYHWNVYGTDLLTQSASVWMFGFINCIMVFILRSPIFTDFFHAANNLAVIIGRVTKIGFFVSTGGS